MMREVQAVIFHFIFEGCRERHGTNEKRNHKTNYVLTISQLKWGSIWYKKNGQN